MKLAVLVAAIGMVLTLSASVLEGRVVRVSDGDTITVLDELKVQHKVRLNRIDAPEKTQAFGEVSRKYLSNMVANKAVRVEWTKKDKYGRILGDVSVGSTNVNLMMVQSGLAWHFKRFDNTESFALAESEARGKRIGIWKQVNPIAPWEFREQVKNTRRKNT